MTNYQKRELLQLWLAFVRAFNAYLRGRGLQTVDYDPDQKRDRDGKLAKEGKARESDPFGEAYTEYSGKPEAAIEKLLKEKSGHVPAAIYKEGIGDIDFVYGEAGDKGTEKGYGLAHIIRRRNEKGYDGEAFAKLLLEIIRNGRIEKRGYSNRAYIISKDK